jgi:hypothetical protein
MVLSRLRGAQPLQFVEGLGENADGARGGEMLPGDELAGAAHRLEFVEMRHHDLREARDVLLGVWLRTFSVTLRCALLRAIPSPLSGLGHF